MIRKREGRMILLENEALLFLCREKDLDRFGLLAQVVVKAIAIRQ